MIRGWGAGLRAWTLCAALLAQDPGAAAAHAIILESEPAADGSEKLDRIVLPLGSLRPGAYVVRYKVLAADGHITEGALRFTVLEPK